MPPPAPPFYRSRDAKFKKVALMNITFYLIFLFLIASLHVNYIPDMVEAGEETSDLLNTGEAGGGGAVQAINNEFADEVRTASVISLISFGILDCIFAAIFIFRKVKVGHENALFFLGTIQVINRLVSSFFIVRLIITVFVTGDPRGQMNSLYYLLVMSSVLSVLLILIIYTKLIETRPRRIAFKIREGTTV